MFQLFIQSPEFLLAVLLLALFLLNKRPEINNYLAKTLVNVATGILPCRYVDWMSRQQYHLGLRGPEYNQGFLAWKICSTLICFLFAFILPLPFVMVLAILVFFSTDIWLIAKVAKRKRMIADGLPQALDLMLLCVDAGLGLDAAVQKIAREKTLLSSELSEELSRLSRDILLGMDRESAYWDLYTRTGVEEVRSLSAAINQSQKLGLSISNILRTQSEFLRYRQQKRAEERSARLPVWMAFPLWFCIMPALLLVLVGPSLLLFLNQVHPLPPGWGN